MQTEATVRIRRFRPEEAPDVASLVARTLRISNSRDYTPEYLARHIRLLQPEDIAERARQGHFYVACEGERIIGCGGIGRYWDSCDESWIFTVFVAPEYQGQGIGTRLMQVLEEDRFFVRARRIEIPASITGVSFYRQFGYTYKSSTGEPDGEGLIRLEKHKTPGFRQSAGGEKSLRFIPPQ